MERPDEAEQLRIAREIPGFGGYFLDKAGQLVIRMSVAGAETRAKTRVLDLVRRERQQSHLGNAFQREPIIVASRFDLVQLAGWRDRLVGPALELSGINFVDLDEAQNVITVGFENASAKGEAQRLFSAMRIPEDAVVFESSQLAPTVDLFSRIRPLTAGTQMGPAGCSLGAAAIREGVEVILTASHCTAVWNTDDFGPTSQNLYSPSFGTEVFDENGWICGVFRDVRCRFADVAAYSISGLDVLEGETGFQLGRIARPIYAVAGVDQIYGPVQIDDANPFFQITGTYDYPLMNETMHKVGVTTGWTYGNIYKTCTDVSYNNTSPKKRYVCQDWAALFGQPGDSGGPVFLHLANDNAVFMGLITGRSTGSGTIFGNVYQLRRDLGPFQVF